MWRWVSTGRTVARFVDHDVIRLPSTTVGRYGRLSGARDVRVAWVRPRQAHVRASAQKVNDVGEAAAKLWGR